jgi:hypothetical protein
VDGKKMLMKIIMVAFVLLFICVHTHSENADISYADYCVRFEESDTMFSVKFLLVKEHRQLEPIRLDTHKLFKCDTLSWSEGYYFDVVDNIVGELLHRLTSFGVSFYGTPVYFSPGGGILNPVISADHVPESRILIVKGRQMESWKKGMLSLKETQYTNVKASVRYRCPPQLDTTFQMNYRVRLIGECKQTR